MLSKKRIKSQKERSTTQPSTATNIFREGFRIEAEDCVASGQDVSKHSYNQHNTARKPKILDVACLRLDVSTAGRPKSLTPTSKTQPILGKIGHTYRPHLQARPSG